MSTSSTTVTVLLFICTLLAPLTAAVSIPAATRGSHKQKHQRLGTPAAAASPFSEEFIGQCHNPEDCSDELQAAIYSGASTIRITDPGFPWRICKVSGHTADGIVLNITNTHLIFEPGVVIEARAGCFGSLRDPTSLSGLFRTRNDGPDACYPARSADAPFCTENVTIDGYGAIFQMRKHDYMNGSIYAHSEDREGVGIYRAKNLILRGLKVIRTGGDGLYVKDCYTCTFVDLTLDDNYRQACSVISASDTLFENCNFINTGMTGGTAPQAGVDFEPNGPSDFLHNLTLRNCSARNNVGGGYFVSYNNLNNNSRPVSIAFDHCFVDGHPNNQNAGLYAYALPGYPDNKTTAVAGSIRWTGGMISNTKWSAISLSVPLHTDFSVVAEDVIIDGRSVRSTGPFATSPLTVGMWPGRSNEGLRKASGDVRLSNVTVIDNVARPFLLINSTSRDVRGSFTVHNPSQCNASLAVSCNGCPSLVQPLSQRGIAVSYRCAKDSMQTGRSNHASGEKSLKTDDPDTTSVSPETVFFASNERHSFMDTSLIDSSMTLQLELKQQTPDHDFGALRPLVTADASWENNCEVGSYSSVYQDVAGGKMSLFYQLYCSEDVSTPMTYGANAVGLVAVAESTDGVVFTKPLVGNIEFRNSSRNNIVMLPPISQYNTSSVTELEGCSVFRDPHSRRLISVAALGTKLSVWTALDDRGFKWNLTAQWEIGFDDSQSVMFWDRARSEFSLYTRAKAGDTATVRSVVRGVRRLGVRSIADPNLPVRKSIWDNNFGTTVLMPDAIDNSTHIVEEPTCSTKVRSRCTNQPVPVDFYGATVVLLANVTPPSYLGFIQRLWHWQGPGPPKSVDGTMLWPGKIDVELATSEDGLHFRRFASRQPLLSVGRHGHWASAFKWAMPSLVYFGDSEFLYYAGRNYNHNLETERGIESPNLFRSGVAGTSCCSMEKRWDGCARVARRKLQ
eukprot:COSAG02_NODE_841_length_16613_cov_61.635703_6_plen_961_part_00